MQGPIDPEVTSVNWGEDAIVRPYQLFDLNIEFLKDSTHLFDPGETVTLAMTGSGLNETMFDTVSTPVFTPVYPGEVPAMIRMFDDHHYMDISTVPEPASLLVLGLGVIAGVRRRPKREQGLHGQNEEGSAK